MRKITQRDASSYYDDNIDRYAVEKLEAFKECILDQLEAYISLTNVDDLSVDNFAEDIANTFEFKEEGDWLADEFESFIGDFEDAAYEEEKDRRMGLD